MTDYLFEYRGRVERGRRLGHALGAPTANLALGRDVDCAYGTFAAIVEGLERPYCAVAHVGVRPSVSAGAEPLLEAHLLDFEGDLYGREVVVKVEHKVADEVRLDSLDALAEKIAADVASVRAYFAATTRGAPGRFPGAPLTQRVAGSKDSLTTVQNRRTALPEVAMARAARLAE
jgi:riboflavin kinase/FMN adenylyltransferase